MVNSGELVENIQEGEVMLDENKNSKEENQTIITNITVEDYFAESRLTRDKMYSQMLESYQKILESSNISESQKQIATQEISNINNKKNAIMICENLIKNKGIEDVCIFVNDKSISVIVKAINLEEEQIAQVQNIITRELNVDISNIHISNKS